MHAKKSLGQHFLTSASALGSIIEAGNIEDSDTILEIGPGKGILTRELLTCAGKVVAVEKDRELIALLKEKFAVPIADRRLTLISSDILKWNITSAIPTQTPYKVIANIPYYITGAILEKFLTLDSQPERMVLLVQKEVAERIVARDGKESILSLSVKAYGTPRIVRNVPRGSFTPAPTVDSAILVIENISRKNFETVDEHTFFSLVKKGFGSKRKFLRRNVGASEEEFNRCSIALQARAEDVTLEKWLCLARQ